MYKRKEPRKLGSAGAPLPCDTAVADPPKYALPDMCYRSELGRSTSKGMSVIKRSAWKFDHSHSAFQGHWRSSGPTRTGPPPMTSY